MSCLIVKIKMYFKNIFFVKMFNNLIVHIDKNTKEDGNNDIISNIKYINTIATMLQTYPFFVRL